jgi:hypothetical protein
MEGKIFVPGMGSINTHDPPRADLQLLVAYPMASSLTWQLFKLPGSVPARIVCIQPCQVWRSKDHFTLVPRVMVQCR